MKAEINIYIMIAMLFIHWFADFVCQTDWQATNKSKSNYALTSHVLTYTGIWFASFLIYYGFVDGMKWTQAGVNYIFIFPIITFCCHWLTDYCTSRLNSKLHKAGKIHYFFVSIGFDQILHYVQLIITFQLLS